MPAVLGGGVEVGSPVFAVGHPLGLTNSLSAGVVSALDHSVRAEGQLLEHLGHFDAAVSPGNSGPAEVTGGHDLLERALYEGNPRRTMHVA